MAAAPAGKMTGANKALVGTFVVLKLVESRIAWAEEMGEEARDEDLAMTTAMDWARAFGAANLAARVKGAAEKAALVAKNYFEVLDDRAAVHIAQGRGVDDVDALYVEEFEEVFGEAPVAVLEPAHRPKKQAAGAPRAAGRAAQSRAAAVVAGMCADPLAVDALGGLLTLLTADCLRQCLPLLPPAGGTAATAEWLALLKSQGPFWVAHWHLGRIREAAGPAADEAACEALARRLTDIVIASFRAMEFQNAAPSYIRLRLVVLLASMTSKEEVRSAWSAFLGNIGTAALSGGVEASELAAAQSPEGECQLVMVLDELAQTWGNLTFGRWPEELFLRGATSANADLAAELAATSGGDGGSDEDGEDEDDDDEGPGESHRRPPVAVMNMAGAALASILRKLGGPQRRRDRAARDAKLLELDVDPEVVEEGGGIV